MPIRLPLELFPNIVRRCDPAAGRSIRCANKALSRIVTENDLAWGEAGWRLNAQGAENCWRWAIQMNHGQVVRWWLEARGMPVDHHNNYALRTAVTCGHVELVRLLMDHGANLDVLGTEALRTSAMYGRLEMVRLLLEKGVDARNNGRALSDAARNGHAEVVQMLLENGADVHADQEGPLMYATGKGYHKVVRIVLEHGADVHYRRDEPLISAAYSGYAEVIQLLLAYGADIHARGDGALRTAAVHLHLEAVRVLLERGGDIHADDDRAIRAAAEFKQWDVVRLLFLHGGGYKELRLAAKNADEAVEYLLREGEKGKSNVVLREKKIQFEVAIHATIIIYFAFRHALKLESRSAPPRTMPVVFAMHVRLRDKKK
ncbi:hypothetical protein HK104_007581 [Borealophlyctis nickersoniae]|nr:hypothetical protein HK104_007581 [Borealophlyctis nickersoniae]